MSLMQMTITGKEAFVKLHEFLLSEPSYVDGKLNLGMAGFILGNTLSENGAVTEVFVRSMPMTI